MCVCVRARGGARPLTRMSRAGYHVAHHKEEEAAALKEYRAKHAHH